MLVKEYEDRLRKLLEEPNVNVREIIYFGIAKAFVDHILKNNPNNFNIREFQAQIRIDSVAFLGKVVELTIVDAEKLKQAISNNIDYRVALFKNDFNVKLSYDNVSDIFNISNHYSIDFLNNLKDHTKAFSSAYVATEYYLLESNKAK